MSNIKEFIGNTIVNYIRDDVDYKLKRLYDKPLTVTQEDMDNFLKTIKQDMVTSMRSISRVESSTSKWNNCIIATIQWHHKYSNMQMIRFVGNEKGIAIQSVHINATIGPSPLLPIISRIMCKTNYELLIRNL